MGVVRCEAGHFYDDGKFTACPHCTAGHTPVAAKGALRMGDNTILDSDKTVSKASHDILKQTAMQQRIVEFSNQKLGRDEKTVGLFLKTKGYDPVVGWLVCIVGPEKGRDYRLHAGRNFIGRAQKMDVSVTDDQLISRENHASIVYEPKKSAFSVVPGSGTTVLLNGQIITQSATLCDNDSIAIGQSVFAFVSFCKGEVRW